MNPVALRLISTLAGTASKGVAVSLLALLVGLALVASADASPAYLVILIGAAGLGASAFWFRDTFSVLLAASVFTATITVTKALPYSPMAKYGASLVLTAHEIFLFPLIGMWLWDRLFIRHAAITDVPGNAWAFGFLCFSVFSALRSDDVPLGLAMAAYYLKFYVVFLLFSDLFRRPDTIRLIMYAMWAGLALQCLMALGQFVTRSPLAFQGAKGPLTSATNIVFADAGGEHAFRPFGFLLHPNAFANYLTYLLPPIAVLLLACGSRLARPLFWALCGLLAAGFGCLVVSLSRGGWIAFGLAMFIALIVAVRRGLISRKTVSRVAIAAAVGLVLTIVVYPTAILRLTKSDNRSTETRLMMNDQALLMIGDNLLLGVGLGSYSAATAAYTPMSFSNAGQGMRDQLKGAIVHNKYLLTTAEGGLIGLGVMLGLFVAMLRTGYGAIGFGDPVYNALALGLTTCVGAQLIFFGFDHFMIENRQILLWSHFGMLSGLAVLHRQQATMGQLQERP